MSTSAILTALFAATALAADMVCPGQKPSSNPQTADGVAFKVLANGLKRPRGVIQDSEGNILMSEGKGLRRIELDGADGMDLCVKSSTHFVEDATVRFS